MKTDTSLVRFYKSKDTALQDMRLRNRTVKSSGEVYVVTDWPEGDYAVTDLATAIEIGNGYVWEA